jgi:hypothetical protein
MAVRDPSRRNRAWDGEQATNTKQSSPNDNDR